MCRTRMHAPGPRRAAAGGAVAPSRGGAAGRGPGTVAVSPRARPRDPERRGEDRGRAVGAAVGAAIAASGSAVGSAGGPGGSYGEWWAGCASPENEEEIARVVAENLQSPDPEPQAARQQGQPRAVFTQVTAGGHWGGEGRKSVAVPAADLQLQHRHSALHNTEDGQHPPGNSSGPAESEFNACRKEEGRGTAIGNSLLQRLETPICWPHLKSRGSCCLLVTAI